MLTRLKISKRLPLKFKIGNCKLSGVEGQGVRCENGIEKDTIIGMVSFNRSLQKVVHSDQLEM